MFQINDDKPSISNKLFLITISAVHWTQKFIRNALIVIIWRVFLQITQISANKLRAPEIDLRTGSCFMRDFSRQNTMCAAR
jgi:hypothetical protein